MQKQQQEELFNPLGICRKVFSFITGLFSPHPRASTGDKTVPCHGDQDTVSGSTVQVHFKQSEDQDLDSSVPVESERFNTISAEATKNQEPTSQTQARRWRGDQPKNKDDGKKQTPKPSGVGIKQREAKKTENEKTTAAMDTEKKPKVKYQPHLISVAPNINEKSESFIKTRIEAMRRNVGLDPLHS